MASVPPSDQVQTTRRNITGTLGGREVNSKRASCCYDPVSIRVNSRMGQGQVPHGQILGTVTNPALARLVKRYVNEMRKNLPELPAGIISSTLAGMEAPRVTV
jgi:hypothetical protein